MTTADLATAPEARCTTVLFIFFSRLDGYGSKTGTNIKASYLHLISLWLQVTGTGLSTGQEWRGAQSQEY